ncbi:MAG: VOC family protein [Saprospiraceae bacterium]|nr:VOC family protein [Saprospiraceae bacterium]
MERSLTKLCIFYFVLLSCSPEKSLPIPDAGFAALIVNDIDVSVNWYSEVFSLTVLNKVNLEDRGIKQVNLKGENMHIELIELTSAVAQNEILKDYPNKTKIEGIFKVGYYVSKFDEWVDSLIELDVNFNGDFVKDNLSGKRMLVVFDPDGNRIQFFEK